MKKNWEKTTKKIGKKTKKNWEKTMKKIEKKQCKKIGKKNNDKN